ncbi:kelch domain-containing protein 3-like [Amblyomma americanum]
MRTVRLNGVPEHVTHRAVCINGKVYSFNSGFEPRNFVDVFIFDPASHRWDMVQGVAPVRRREHSAFVYNEELYIFGGYSDILQTSLADMHKYDPETSCWTEVRPCG